MIGVDPKQEKLLRQGQQEGGVVTIAMAREEYERNGDAANALKELVEDGYLQHTQRHGVFAIVDVPWKEGQQDLDTGW